MKKMICLLLALFLVLGLSACSAAGSGSEATSSPAPTQQELPEETASSVEPSESPADAQETPEAAQTLGKLGNSSGNLNAGGNMVLSEDGTLFFAQTAGLYSLKGGLCTKISDDRAASLNLWDGRLYYIAQVYSTDESAWSEVTSASIVSCALDGSDRKVLLDSRPVHSEDVYPESGSEEEAIHSLILTSSTRYCGYSDLIVWDGQLYYIADNGNSGSTEVTEKETNNTAAIAWDSDKSIYRANLDGSNGTEIVSNVGSDSPHLCSDGEKLYYATGYANCFFSYPIVSFWSCNPDGSEPTRLATGGSEEETYFSCEKGDIFEIVDGLFAENGRLYVSASDSEGDFASTRLMLVGDTYAYLQDELYYVHSLGDGQGNVVSFLSDNGTEFVIDDEGVYGEEYAQRARLVLAPDANTEQAETLMSFEHLLRFGDEFSTFTMAYLDGKLYLMTDRAIYTVDPATKTVETLLDGLPDNPATFSESEN